MSFENANWNDLKYFLALARYKRYSKAAAHLRTTHVTVANTIKRLEDTLQSRLFQQTNEGFKLTSEGATLLPVAEACERHLLTPGMNAEANQIKAPCVRIGVTEGIGNSYVAERVASWLLNTPLDMELVTLPKQLRISQRDADICITVDRPDGRNMTSQLLTPYKLGIFTSEDYIARHPQITSTQDLKNHGWVGYVDDHIFSSTLEYHKEISQDLRYTFRSTSMVSQMEAAMSGVGLAILPIYMVKDKRVKMPPGRRLVRVLPDLTFNRKYWISASNDMDRFPYIHALWHGLLKMVETDYELFMGE
ncbi:LysR family transcriptional regulator [Terasakiella pusilla]|jgi:DNA-binding transcriptional LysR family regulator|uniref:LysR family transcriptional regulator n=1 Tax=Terasakiella pusilla TaxID=64973 RepID=UPI00048B3B57|nr:LysR family transcriptional regulator [Terasakiella pusilla]